MLVSVLTPSFNQARWLSDNLRSVANQTYPQIEHIVMDGGSTDGSVEWLESESGPHVRWICEPDRGQAHALNKAFEFSTGEIIGWINSDDAYVDSRSIETAVAYFREHPWVGAVFGHSLLVNADGEVMQFLWTPKRMHFLRKYLTSFYQPAIFFRRALIDDYLVDERLQYVMDFDLWQRLYKKTDFDRIDIVVGLERHQSERKVLQPGYLKEVESYNQNAGIDRGTAEQRIVRKAAHVLFRVVGLPHLVFGSPQIESTVQLIWPSRLVRARRQLLVGRASMPLEQA